MTRWLYQTASTPYRHYSAKVVELSAGSVKPQHPVLVLQGRSSDWGVKAGETSCQSASMPDTAASTVTASSEPTRKRRSRWGVTATDGESQSSALSVAGGSASSRIENPAAGGGPSVTDSVAALAAYAPPHHSLGTATQVHSSAAASTSFSTKAAPPPGSYSDAPKRSEFHLLLVVFIRFFFNYRSKLSNLNFTMLAESGKDLVQSLDP